MSERLRIGDVARRTGLTVRTLRHYDELGLLTPSARSDGDYRLYDDADLRRLLAIQHLKSLGLGLADIARALDDPAFDAADALRRHAAHVEERIASERELLRRLRRLDGPAEAGWDEVLAAIRLTELLRHPDSDVRLRAALASPTAASAATLVDSLVGEEDPAVREVVTWALVQQPADAVAALLGRLGDEGSGPGSSGASGGSGRGEAGHERGNAEVVAHALGKLGDPAAVGPLAGLLLRDDPGVAAKAAFALGQIGGDEAMAALVDAVGVADAAVRDAVTDALAHLGLAALDPVGDLLIDAHPSVREHAAEILGLLAPGGESAPAGREAADAHAADAQADSAAALTGLLSGALADPDAGVRFAALLSLGRLRTDDAGRAIESALSSADERTRLLAERLVSDRR